MTPEDQIIKLLQKDILLEMQQAYGDFIMEDFKSFVEKLKSLYRSIDLSQYSSVVAIFKHSEMGSGMKVSEKNVYQHCKGKMIVNFLDEDGYIEVISNPVDILALSMDTFVYKWNPNISNSDSFVIKGVERLYCQDPCTNGLSYFAVKTYKDLDKALIYYRDNMALEAKGKALCDAMRHNRLFFKNAPEDLLQEALCEYLTATLRDMADVKREVTVDESHPVDISITFKTTNHIALIEIKWVGRSLNEKEDGFSGYYTNSRANKGAKQLVDYIDANRASFPSSITAGYLVVYDLRRKHNNNPKEFKISRKDGDCYRLKELNMIPDYKRKRSDYKGTYRFFVKVDRNAYCD